MNQEDKKVEEIKEEMTVEEPKSDPVPVKSPRKSKVVSKDVNVKLIRRFGDTGLFENVGEPGDFYLVELSTLEPGTRKAAINPSNHAKPQDWSVLLDQHLPSREQMIADACAHLVKNGMVVLDDLNNNAIRSKAFREMLNYTIPKNPDE